MTYLKIYVSVSSKNVSVEPFNMIARTYEAKTLIKHISCECKCKFDSTTCDSVQKYNNDISHCGFTNLLYVDVFVKMVGV